MRPPHSEGGWEVRLHDANVAARNVSLRWCASFIPAIDWNDWAQTTDAATLVVTDADPACLEALDTDAMVDGVTGDRDPRLQNLVKLPDQPGSPFPVPGISLVLPAHELLIARLAHGPVARAIADGQTMILNQVEQYHRPLAQAADHLGRVMGSQVGINCYLSYGKAEGFGAHWDDHDVVIVQTEGRKYWEIYQPTELSALRPNVSDAVSDQLVWSGVLEPGSALLIPRGWGHRVETFDELSVHLTIGLNRIPVLGILEQMAADSSNHPLFRADIPYDPSRPATSYAGSVFDAPSSFAEHLGPLVDVAVNRGVARMRAAIPMTPASSQVAALRVTLGDNWWLGRYEARLPGGVMVVERPEPDDVAVAAGRQMIEMPLEYLPVYAACTAGRPVGVADLLERDQGLDEATVCSALRSLVGAGVVHVVGVDGT